MIRTPIDKNNTFRLTKFKGLNKSVDPQNIDDAEFTDMVNVELSENRGLQSRLGFTKVIDHIDPVITAIRGLYKADWDDYTSTLYASRSWTITKNNETTGYEQSVGVLPNPSGKPVHFQRWKNRLLILAEGETLKWMNGSEVLNPVEYPQFTLVPSYWYTAVTAGTYGNNALEASTHYQYNVSFVLGYNYRDGETPGVLSSDNHITMAKDDYAGCTTNGTDKSLVGGVMYEGKLNGFAIGKLLLFRRKAKHISSEDYSWSGDGPWVLIDTAYVKKSTDHYYTLELSVTKVITNIGGAYNATTDNAVISVGFTDDGAAEHPEKGVDPSGLIDDYDAGHEPLSRGYLNIPKAKYMARVNNRIFLGNIVGSDARDKKTVRFTYTGYLDPNATLEEIPNFHYAFPMLIFGPFSWFYCDSEDTDDPITGMYGYRNSLMIFTGKCTFLWQEGMKDPVKISNDVGCIANGSIREFEGRLIWLSANGVVMYDGSKLKNLTQDKANSYIMGLSRDYAWKSTATIFNRKYYIAAPFYGGTDNACILVYDFDLDEWFERRYRITNDTTYFFVDCFYKYNHGSKETLYAGGHNSSYTTSCYIVKLDEGYNDGDALIECSIRTKYYDFGAPDIIKDIRAFNIDMTNYSGSLAIRVYLDNLNDASYRHTHTGIVGGFIVGGDNPSKVNVDCIVNVSDEMFAFSLPMAQRASRVQYGLSFNAGPVQTSIRAISFDWRTVRKQQRKYGG